MNELFDTTALRTGSALRRRLAEANTLGQGDLFVVVAVARRVAADAVMVWPAPVGAFWARDDLTGAAMLA
jgi:hypothetical protein